MTKGVTICRDDGKLIPVDYLAKAFAMNKFGMGVAIARTGGTKVIVRKSLKASAQAADEFQRTDGIKDIPIIIHFAGTQPSAEEDLQPFVLLNNDDESVALAVFLDGDFSAYEAAGSAKSPEAHCVEKAILPRIEKAVSACDGDIDKIMDFLSDEITAQDWANFMLGARGSITLIACNGRTQTIGVEGDTTQKSFDGWWTSNSYGYGEAPKSLASSAADELLGTGSKPKLSLGSKLLPKKTVASTTPISQPVSAPAPAKDGEQLPDATPPVAALEDADAMLSIKVPTGMAPNRAWKWWTKRCPQHLLPNSVTGLSEIKLRRRDANPTFIQTFLEQNKLAGLGALKGSVAPPAIVNQETKIPQVAAAKKGIPQIGSKRERSYPERAEAAPAEQPAPPPVEEPKEGPSVVGEPLPVLSPNQREEIVHFHNDPAIKLAIDQHTKQIASPHGLEQLEKKVESLSKQFGGRLSIMDIAKWPQAHFHQYGDHDHRAVEIMAFCLAIELNKAYRMLDELTNPQKIEVEKPQVPQQPVAKKTGGIPTLGRKKVA